ncbi:tRNA guanosine(34) transglycosylase Tgt, partial [Candidatus Woesebacteria bacterium]|nr:tRNA guanosine(34) transglycosylase Tgt [Candidatus Woesebacteria bacterium]
MLSNFFSVNAKDNKTKARTGVIHTKHGDVQTPAFVPVATSATLKSLSSEEITSTKTQLAFVNTYHLHLRPGDELIKKLGGVHKFMNCQGPLISDSGGFQVFSLGFGLEQGIGKIANIFIDEQIKTDNLPKKESLVKIDDNGVTFRSHIDGKKLRLTPEISIKIQENLGTDIALAFDECTSPLSDWDYTKKALDRTHAWANICLDVHSKKDQALYGIVQGGHFDDLRTEACEFMSNSKFDGFGIGGDLGRSKKEMLQIVEFCLDRLPKEKPIHILGIGEIDDIFNIIEKGADTFDCVMPSRFGRVGQILTDNKEKDNNTSRKFSYDITKSKYESDSGPLVPGCNCWVCQNYSKAYVHHLFKAKELLGYRLATFHNVYFLNNLVEQIRNSII